MSTQIGDPTSPEIERRVQDSFARQGLMALLGARLTEVRHGLVTIRMPFRPELSQQHGYFHAGGTAAIADSAGGYAGFTLFPNGSSVLTVEFKINLINPAEGDALEAIGRVAKRGRTLTICQFEVFALANDRRTPVALGQQTLMCMTGRPDGPTAG
ncbi:PaaI family thioesterase [Xanthobacter sp. V4C-4]|uniref:PaaI family thioesterase n=1 Tax=Xanthobacter cornucopiae TaxID=3119924 RepID=UPI0037288106